MASVQLSFTLRTSPGVKTVHLLGSWDNYAGQLPLSKDKSSSKSGAWKGTFKFQGALLHPGQRCWYYYIVDGYHVSHDPAQVSTVEPTTGRTLNILDVPAEKSSSRSSKSSSSRHSEKHSDKHSDRHSGRHSDKYSSEKRSSKHTTSSSSSRRKSRHESSSEVAKGRPLSISQIQSPKPVSPYATKTILQGTYGAVTLEELTSRFGSAALDDDEYDYAYDDELSASPPSSTGSSLSSRSNTNSDSSSLTDYSSPDSEVYCQCERYGITRTGERIKLDCGGSRCGYDDENSSCCSSDNEEFRMRSSRRNGIVIR